MFAGIHDNPVHREQLRRRFTQLANKTWRPSFIAVEANSALFHAVIQRQRDVFVSMAQKDDVLRNVKPGVLRDLSLAISYEADAHLGIFLGEPQTVWLDDVRLGFSTACNPCDTANRYLFWCKKAVGESELVITNSTPKHELFEAVDAFMTQSVDQPSIHPGPLPVPTFDRDHLWMEMLKDMLTPETGPCGIIVVGAEHAQDKPDYLRYLLGRGGHHCEVQSLRTQPQPASGADG